MENDEKPSTIWTRESIAPTAIMTAHGIFIVSVVFLLLLPNGDEIMGQERSIVLTACSRPACACVWCLALRGVLVAARGTHNLLGHRRIGQTQAFEWILTYLGCRYISLFVVSALFQGVLGGYETLSLLLFLFDVIAASLEMVTPYNTAYVQTK
jgi:hypothetical protein